MLAGRPRATLALALLVMLFALAPSARAQGTFDVEPVEGPVEGWSTVEFVGTYTNEGDAPQSGVDLEGEILLNGTPFKTLSEAGPAVEPGESVQFTVPVELGEPGTYEARFRVVADGVATEPSAVTFQAEGGTPPATPEPEPEPTPFQLEPLEGPHEGWSTVELVGIYVNEGGTPQFDVELQGEILLDGAPFATISDRGPVIEPGKAVQFTVPVELGEPGTYEARLWVVADGATTEPSAVTFQAEGGTPPTPTESGTPWLWIALGAALLLAAAAAGAFVLLQRKAAAAKAKAKAKSKGNSKGKPKAVAKAKPKAKAGAKSAAKPKGKPTPPKALQSKSDAKPVSLVARLRSLIPSAPAKAATATGSRKTAKKATTATAPPTPSKAAAPKPRPKPAPAKEPAQYANQILKAFQELNANIESALPRAPEATGAAALAPAPREEIDDQLDTMLEQMRARFPHAAAHADANETEAPEATPVPPQAPDASPAPHSQGTTAPPGTLEPGPTVVPVGSVPAPRPGDVHVVRVKNPPAPPEKPFTTEEPSNRVVSITPQNPEPTVHKLGEGAQRVYKSSND